MAVGSMRKSEVLSLCNFEYPLFLKTSASCSVFKTSETAVVVCPTLRVPPLDTVEENEEGMINKDTRCGNKRKRCFLFLTSAVLNLLLVTVVSMLTPTSRSFRNAPAASWADAHQQSQPSEDVDLGPITGHNTLLGIVFSHSAPTECDRKRQVQLLVCTRPWDSWTQKHLVISK